MSSPRGSASLWFLVVAGVMVAVLSWLTVALVQLDGDEREARREAAVHERLRLALWRMDSWLSPQLARENLRAASDYVAFPAASNAWTKGFKFFDTLFHKFTASEYAKVILHNGL